MRRALQIGFTLAELAEVLKARDAGGTPCRRVYQLAEDKLKGVAADIEALKGTERYLKKVLSDWKQRIQRAEEGQLLFSCFPRWAPNHAFESCNCCYPRIRMAWS